MERRLAAIMSADVVGYSRLIRADEEGTIAALKGLRADLIDPKIDEHNGRIVKLMGDGMLAEFPSVVEAVRAAVETQQAVAVHNADLPEDKRIEFRVGINLGDVVIDGDDIQGDGVNIAARLEGISVPGGICISGSVYEQVRDRTDYAFEDLGEQEVKNIDRPVRVFRVSFNEKVERLSTSTEMPPSKTRRKTLSALAAGLALCIMVVVGGVWWQLSAPVSRPAQPMIEADRLSALPSVAVLPFANISGDPEQEYFADGMTEDLITDLSKISDLIVISRTSTSGYKGKKIDVREVGKALNVRYVIEGSVRKAGERVRISAQLIDASTGAHLWAERYDGNLNDIFSLQDQVLEKIVASLALKLSEKERQRLATRGTDSVQAHDLYLRGLSQESLFTRDGNREALQFYEQALSIDPDYALPYARMANVLELSARNGWADDVQANLKKAVELAEKAIDLDPQNPTLHWSLGRVVARLRTPGALERGIKSLERAIELDSKFADAYAFLAVMYVGDGRAEDGLRTVETAMRLNRRYPFWYIFMRGVTRYVVEDYELAIADFEAAAERNPAALFVRWWLAAAYALAGQIDDAEWQVEEMQSLGFVGSIATILNTSQIRDPGYLAIYEAGLRKAGIPE